MAGEVALVSSGEEKSRCIQWRDYGVALVAISDGPRAGGSQLGPPASELKTLKIFFTKYNYVKYVCIVLFIAWNFIMYFSVNSSYI